MNIDTLNSMLERWARFYHHYNFGGLGYPSRSILKPDIKSTKPINDIKIPDDIGCIDLALTKLTLRQRQVVNAEFLKEGHYKKKSESLGITHACYRTTLCRAKSKIIEILELS